MLKLKKLKDKYPKLILFKDLDLISKVMKDQGL
jgi:hypothetical protein